MPFKKTASEITPEDRLRLQEIGRKGGNNKASITRHTKAWYMQTLLKIAKGQMKCKGPQLAALNKFAEMRGWYSPKHKKNILSERNLKKALGKPAITDDLSARISALIPKPQPTPSSALPVAIVQPTGLSQPTVTIATNA